MLRRIIDFHIEHRWFVLVGVLAIVAAGLWTMFQIPVDAFPDLTNNQVVVSADCPGMPPAEVEQLVTFPIETSLMGIPKTEGIRSVSKLGVSIVTIVFDDSVPTYFARQLVNEKLQEARTRLPGGIDPTLGPVATAFGEVYQYTLAGSGYSTRDLKTLHEWQIRNQLRTIPGVNEVNSWGGETRQIEIIVDPARLRAYGLTLRDLFERVRENNANFGGGYIEHSAEQYTVRGIGRAGVPGDLEGIVLAAKAGTPVLLRNVAEVRDGAMQRQGAVTRDGKGETVSGMIIMLKGENGKHVIERVKERVARLSLPPGVRIDAFYDQSTVIDRSMRTVLTNLVEGAILVGAVLLLFLRNVRAALIVAAVIPLSMLVAVLGMQAFGVSANLMSLGAIDFGLMVDGAVVMVENMIRRLSRDDSAAAPADEVRNAAHEVARPILFAVAIIIAVYIPIFFLEGLERRMFRPMAITVCSGLVGALVFSLTVVPAAASVHFRHRVRQHKETWFEHIRIAYEALLAVLLRARITTAALAIAIVAAAVVSVAYIGTEFMPRLDEGSILIESRKLPGIALSDSVAISTRVEQVVRQFQPVESIVTKIGRPDLATEAMGVNQGDVYVILRPREQWQGYSSKEQLINAIANKLDEAPGVAFNFTQPMAMRLDEVVSGIKADVAVKIFGEDPRVLEQKAEQVLHAISEIPGVADAQREIVSGVAELTVEPDRTQLARYGFNVSDVRQVIETAVAGYAVSDLVEGRRRFPIVVRLPESARVDAASLREVLLPAPAGELVRLGQIARVAVIRGPESISRENGQRRIVVQCNVRGRDLGSFVVEAQRAMRKVSLPPGYSVDWGGQFENQERATKRLLIVLPLTIVIIFALLFATFNSVPQAILILLNVPFAVVGGIAALWLRGLNLNLSASVGFIALFGVAVLNGILVVSHINELRLQGHPLERALIEGAGARLRPVLMTALVASLGFVPMALATSAGAEVQRPLATVVIGGLITSTTLMLPVLPVVYPWFSPRKMRTLRHHLGRK